MARVTKKSIMEAWARIREIDSTIPDEVLDYMKDASISRHLDECNDALAVSDAENSESKVLAQVVLDITSVEEFKKIALGGTSAPKGRVVVMAVGEMITDDLERLEKLEEI